MSRTVIGEGTYGCVQKPSLHCSKKTDIGSDFNYKNYVSKIMKTKDAETELKEFIVMDTYDPTNKYHLGPSMLCQPELNDKIIDKDISSCKYIKSNEIKSHPNDYKIMLMKFGGPDFKNLCSSELHKYLSTKKRLKTDQFWLEVHHLITGLQFFKKSGLVHNDIKPQNILFNMKTGKLAFIDFGLMRSKEEIIQSSKKSDNFLGIYHWSYPFECGLMNKQKYDEYRGLSVSRKNTYKNQLSEMIIHNTKTNTFKMPISNPNAFNILFAYINLNGDPPPSVTKYGYIEHFFDGINNLMSDTDNTYNDILTDIVNSIDIYGLGFTLQFILNCFYRHGAIDQDFLTRLSTFFHKMYDFNLKTRELNIEILINEYENILLETGVLTRLKKSFVNHIITNKKPVSEKMMKKMRIEDISFNSNSKSRSNSLSKELETFATLDPETTSLSSGKRRIKIRICSKNKDFKLATNRCVNKCKPGQTRNTKFRCIENKTRKQKKRI
jgi:serine/threonine protein kinase